MTPILRTERRWYCPNCPATDITYESKPHTRFHTCKGLRGLTAPFVPVGTRARVYAREREDYVNGEKVQLDPQYRRPVMAVVTERDDGQDAIVFAPVAAARSNY